MARRRPKKIEFLARGWIVRRGRVLLCRGQDTAYWYLPGGHIDPGESAADALRRELLEEAQLSVRLRRVLCVHEHLFTQGKKPRHEITVVYEASPSSALGQVEPGLEFRWINITQLERENVLPKDLIHTLSSGGLHI